MLAPFLQGHVTLRSGGNRYLGHKAILASAGSVAMIVKKFPGVLPPGPRQSAPTSISPTLGDMEYSLSYRTYQVHTLARAWESPAALCLWHSAVLLQVIQKQPDYSEL